MQPGALFRLMLEDARGRLIGNIVASTYPVPRRIQELQIRQFYKADPRYGESVAQGLGLKIDQIVNGELATAAR